MMKSKIVWLSAAFFLFLLSGSVHASYIMDKNTLAGINDGANDNKPENVMKYLDDVLGYNFSMDGTLTGLTAIDASVENDNGQSGTWDTGEKGVDFITVKAGNQYAIYEVGGLTSGDWNTFDLWVGNGKNNPALSHITFWQSPKYEGPHGSGGGGGGSSAVPEPTTMALLFGGLGVLGFNTFRKKFGKKNGIHCL